jgi:hypothetical protein
VYNNLPVPPSVDPAQWYSPLWQGWARRGIRMIRPIYGPPYNTALWDGSSPTTGYDLLSTDSNPNHVTLKWADATPSGFSIVCLPAPGPEATVAILQNSFSGTLIGPPLTIRREASQLRLSWPAAFSCFQVERANALPAPAWFPVSPPPQIVGDENVVTFPLPQANQFYRLHKP